MMFSQQSQEKELTRQVCFFPLLIFDSPCTTKVALFIFAEIPDQDGDYKNDHCRRNKSHQKSRHIDPRGARRMIC